MVTLTGSATVTITASSPRSPHGDGMVGDDGNDEDWCSINEAARRLGVTPTAIRNRIKRGTLQTKPNGNHGRLVRVPRPVPSPIPLTVPEAVPPIVPDTVPLTVTETFQARIADLEARADELRADVERERGERLQERERADRLTSEVANLARQLASTVEEAAVRERALTKAGEEAIALRMELEALKSRPWWRRLVG
jgi:hypothetical protein